MIAIWGNKEHLTCVFPLWFSHEGPTSLKKRPQTLKNPLTPIGSCRELHILYKTKHIYIYIYICMEYKYIYILYLLYINISIYTSRANYTSIYIYIIFIHHEYRIYVWHIYIYIYIYVWNTSYLNGRSPYYLLPK